MGEDIDAILAASKNDTNRLKEEWTERTNKNFSELNIEFNYQEYDGLDYTERRKERMKELKNLQNTMQEEIKGKSSRLLTKFGQIGKERKNYDENAYYREKLRAAQDAINANKNIKSYNKNDLEIPQKLPDIRYWQLYDVENLYTINRKEWSFFNKYKNAHYYNPQKHVALNEEEKKLKQKLLNDGFPQISYRDFGCFVRSIIKYGKNDIDSICNAMIKNGMNQIDENMEEQDIKEMIKKYHAAFFDEKKSKC